MTGTGISAITGLLVAIVSGVAAGLISAWVRIRRSRTSDIAPVSGLQRKYGLYADNRPTIRMDPERVPPHLRQLIPLAEKWGIGDDIIRNDVIGTASEVEKRELHDAFYEPFEHITEWLLTFEPGSLTDEAEAFMYAQGALDEMGYYILEEKAQARQAPGR